MRSGLAIYLTSSLALIERFDSNDGQVEELGNLLAIQKLAVYLMDLVERKEALKLNHHKNITLIPAPAFDLFTTR
jgi:hypothetical protein